MRVLIACEESQRICMAFRAKGHEAFSCDLKPCSGGHPEWHYQIDAEWLVRDPDCSPCIFQKNSLIRIDINCHWDLIIANVPCIYLCNSGVRWLYNEDGSQNEERWQKMKEAAWFFKYMLSAPAKYVCVENSIPHKYALKEIGRKYDQIVHPWMFGNFNENESKATCLWLKNLPKLTPVNPLPAPHKQSVHLMGPSPTRSEDRSKTFYGIAEAMAEQWGDLQ